MGRLDAIEFGETLFKRPEGEADASGQRDTPQGEVLPGVPQTARDVDLRCRQKFEKGHGKPKFRKNIPHRRESRHARTSPQMDVPRLRTHYLAASVTWGATSGTIGRR